MTYMYRFIYVGNTVENDMAPQRISGEKLHAIDAVSGLIGISRIQKTLLFAVFLESEPTKPMTKIINSFEIWIYGRMLRISWMRKITNASILKEPNFPYGRYMPRNFLGISGMAFIYIGCIVFSDTS